jgi:hypothetical protein
MSVTVENNAYVVIIPEQHIRQEINPDTREPFASEAEALAWQDATLGAITAHQTAATAAQAAAHATALAAAVHLEIVADHTEVAVGTAIAIAATLKNGRGDTVPLTQQFAVPIQSDTGAVVKIKGVALVNGVANISLTFDKSGYYRITEQGINSKLDAAHFIGLPVPFEVTVFE